MPSSPQVVAKSKNRNSGAITGRHDTVKLGEAHRARIPLASRFADQRGHEKDWPRKFTTSNNMDYMLEAVQVPKACSTQPSKQGKDASGTTLGRHDKVKLGNAYRSKIPLASRFADQRALGEEEWPRNFNTNQKNDYTREAVQAPNASSSQVMAKSKSSGDTVGRHDGVKLRETYRAQIPLASRFADQRALGETEWPRHFHTTKIIDYQEHQVAAPSAVMAKSASEKAPCQRGHIKLKEEYRNKVPLASRFADQRVLGENSWPRAFTSSNQLDYTVEALKHPPPSTGQSHFQPPSRMSTQVGTRANRTISTASSTSSNIARTSRKDVTTKGSKMNNGSSTRQRPKTAR